MNVREMASAAGLSLRQLALRYEIPYRTMQDWAVGKRTPPTYVLRLLENALNCDRRAEMERKSLWSLETWGHDEPPENVEEIITQANELIEYYAETHGGAEDVRNYSEQLWEHYCTTGTLGEDNRK